MIFVGDNLLQLVENLEIVSDSGCVDETSIQLTLDDKVTRLIPYNNNKQSIDTLMVGEEIPEKCIKKELIKQSGLLLSPKESVLACSHEFVKMPMGYFGLLQTKGSIARLMISIHFSDGQIDPGYNGKVTFEIFNASDFSIIIPKHQKIANLYIINTSTNNNKPYSGRYIDANEPTIYLP